MSLGKLLPWTPPAVLDLNSRPCWVHIQPQTRAFRHPLGGGGSHVPCVIPRTNTSPPKCPWCLLLNFRLVRLPVCLSRRTPTGQLK